MGALGLMLLQIEVGFDIVSIWPPGASIYHVAIALFLLIFIIVAFVYWKRKHSRVAE